MQSQSGARLGAIGGVAFAVLVFLAVAALETPKKATDQEVIDWWSKGGNQASAAVSMFMMLGGGIAFGIFITSFRDRLRDAGSPLANIAHAPGIAASVMMLVAASMRGSIGMAVKVNGEPLPGVDALRLVPELSRTTVEMTCATIAVCALLTAWAVLRAAGLPNWFGWTSAVLGGLSLVLLPLVGPFVLPLELLWGIAGSVVLWRSAPAEVAATRRATTALA